MIDKKKILYSFNELYRSMNEAEESAVIEKAVALKMSGLVGYYIGADYTPDDDDAKIVEILIRILQFIYNNYKLLPPVSDNDYDALYELNTKLSNIDIVGATNASDKIIKFHTYPDLRGTLDKVHYFTNEDKGNDKNRKSIEEWIKSASTTIGTPLKALDPSVYIFPKWDGLSIILECDENGVVETALTRGDVGLNEAVDVSGLFKGLKFEPIDGWVGKFGIKTEVVMSMADFKLLCDTEGEFKSPRSAVSSIINTNELDKKYLTYLTIIPLRAQNLETKEVRVHPAAFSMYPYTVVDTILQLDKLKKAFNSLRKVVEDGLELPIDGMVIHFVNQSIQEALGRVHAINKYEVAYKFPPAKKKTTLLGVDFSLGLLGSMTPVARIKPVKIKGNTIQNVSLGSVDRFESMDLRVGDEVYVEYEIIPYLVKTDDCLNGDGQIIKPPTHCEYCGEELVKDPILKCINNECPSLAVGKIVNYLDKMRIPNISIETVTTLFKHGYLKSIKDLYRLNDHKEEICELGGFGKRSFERIIDGVNSRRDVYDYDMLGALGIQDMGQRMFKKILSIYYIDDLIDICMMGKVKKLIGVKGIQEKTADKIIIGVVRNLDLIEFLTKELVLKKNNVTYKAKVLFTKIRDAEFAKYLETQAIQVMDSYSSDVDIVIVPDKETTSTKIDKAKKNGKEILTIKDAYALFGYNSGANTVIEK